MWTDANRPKYSRDYLRYPSDLNDDEWAVIEPPIPPAKRGGGKRRVDMRAVVDGILDILTPVANGDTFRKTCRRAARCTITSACVAGTARWIASIICNAARSSNAKPVSPSASSMVRASKAPKRGTALTRTALTRQANQGQEASYSC